MNDESSNIQSSNRNSILNNSKRSSKNLKLSKFITKNNSILASVNNSQLVSVNNSQEKSFNKILSI